MADVQREDETETERWRMYSERMRKKQRDGGCCREKMRKKQRDGGCTERG